MKKYRVVDVNGTEHSVTCAALRSNDLFLMFYWPTSDRQEVVFVISNVILWEEVTGE